MTKVVIGLGVVPLKLSHRDDCHRARVPSMPAALIDAFALTRRRGSSNRCFLHLRVAGQLQLHESKAANDSYAALMCNALGSLEELSWEPREISGSRAPHKAPGPLGAVGEASEASWPLGLCAGLGES